MPTAPDLGLACAMLLALVDAGISVPVIRTVVGQQVPAAARSLFAAFDNARVQSDNTIPMLLGP